MVRTVRRPLLRSQLACNEMQASARTLRQTRSRQHDRNVGYSQVKSSQVSILQSSITNYYLILNPRDKAAPLTSQQINKFPPKRVKNLTTPSSIFIFISSSSTGELCSQPIRGNDRRIGRMFQKMLSEAFWTPNIASSQFDEYFELGSRRKVRPVKNQLGSPNTSN